MREVAARWLVLRRAEAKRGDVAPSTVGDNKAHLETHILPMLGDLSVKELDEGSARLRHVIAELRTKPRTRLGKKRACPCPVFPNDKGGPRYWFDAADALRRTSRALAVRRNAMASPSR